MGLLDKAMRTANELAGKAETMLAQSGVTTPGQGGADRVYAELGRLVHDEHRGRPAGAGRRAELLAQLDALEEQASSAPPPPGGPPAPGSMPTATPPSPGSMPPSSPGTGTTYPSAGSTPPPPPPPPPGG